jgi:hypothetical protein
LSRITEIVPGATDLTRRVAEVLYTIREIPYIPKTSQNIARLLVSRTDENLATIIRTIIPELEKLQKAKLVARIGEEYEFLTKEGRNFEEEVLETMSSYRWPDVLKGIEELDLKEILNFTTVPLNDWECPVRIMFDNEEVAGTGDVRIQIYSPLARIEGRQIQDVEEDSTHRDYEQTVFVFCGAVPRFDEQVKYYRAMKTVIDLWKGDPHKSEEARKLAGNREDIDLFKQKGKIRESVNEGLRQAQIIFRGASRSLVTKKSQNPSDALRAELAQFMPGIYSKNDKMPYRVSREPNLIADVLKGDKNLTADMKGIRIFDKAGTIDKQSPLLFEIRAFINEKQSIRERVLGSDLVEKFTKPPYGWHQGAVRAGVAALVRTGDMKVIIEKKSFTNPQDSQLQNALKNSREFNRVQLEMEEALPDKDQIVEARRFLIELIGKRTIPEIPQGIADAMKGFAETQVKKAENTLRWAQAAQLPLTQEFSDGKATFEQFANLTSPHHVIKEIMEGKEKLHGYVNSIGDSFEFTEKFGKTFNEMRDFARELSAVQFRLPADGDARMFLKNWESALSQLTITEGDVWKALQQSRNKARTEVTELINGMKEEAYQEIAEAEESIRKMYAEAAKPGRYPEGDARNVLEKLRAEIESSLDIAATINSVEQVKETIADLIAKVENGFAPAVKEPDKRKKERVRILGSRGTKMISNEMEWNAFRDELDDRVKGILKQNKTVELE